MEVSDNFDRAKKGSETPAEFLFGKNLKPFASE
jgi:hypothetical protein